MSIQKGFKFSTEPNDLKQAKAEHIARQMELYLNKLHSIPNLRDSDTDLFLYQSYADVLRRKKKEGFKELPLPYFTPSSAGSCSRELYMKVKGADRDLSPVQPHQTRWQNIGTAIGDAIQKDLLLGERHFERLTGESCPFEFLKSPLYLEPMFEEFAFMDKLIEAKNPFYLRGTTDGLMKFTDTDGKVYKVGLEIKSKQTTYAGTGFRNMREVNPKHKTQTVCYSLMYDVDFWIVLYVNGSKKSWNMTPEEFAKAPDIRAFGHYVTEEMKEEVAVKFNDILEGVKTENAPKLDLTNWTFNNYKRACALDLTDREFYELIQEAGEVENDTQTPAFVKREVEKAISDIFELRGGSL